ncbi:MAG: hypothetical protein E4G93_01705 [Dehalococcoidia bacterium]|nr:MAG: hypothetical protein E4G93_01705 [Dehalococcoidia bacterium]
MRTLLTGWQVRLGIGLVALSVVGYLIHYAIFRDVHHIFLYLVGDIAFVFLEVLMVTLIIHELLNRHEKMKRMEKLNMVIGAFFSEIGTSLLRLVSDWDGGLGATRERLHVTTLWTEEQFDNVAVSMRVHAYRVDPERLRVAELRSLLASRSEFLLRLMENPNLLEHERFTDLLMATFHLAEELAARREPDSLPDTDLRHLAGDVDRVYGLLARFWLDYMKYLKGNYPYLFSLAVRMNPFDESASPVVK